MISIRARMSYLSISLFGSTDRETTAIRPPQTTTITRAWGERAAHGFSAPVPAPRWQWQWRWRRRRRRSWPRRRVLLPDHPFALEEEDRGLQGGGGVSPPAPSAVPEGAVPASLAGSGSSSGSGRGTGGGGTKVVPPPLPHGGAPGERPDLRGMQGEDPGGARGARQGQGRRRRQADPPPPVRVLKREEGEAGEGSGPVQGPARRRGGRPPPPPRPRGRGALPRGLGPDGVHARPARGAGGAG